MKGFRLMSAPSPLIAASVQPCKTPQEPRSETLTLVQVLPAVVSIPNVCVCGYSFYQHVLCNTADFQLKYETCKTFGFNVGLCFTNVFYC